MSEFSEYRLTKRGTKGVLTIKSNAKIGELVSVRAVDGIEDLLVITLGGIVIRTPLTQVKIAGRNTQGVRIIKLDGKQRVSSIAIVDHVEETEDEEFTEEELLEMERVEAVANDDSPIDLSHESEEKSDDEE